MFSVCDPVGIQTQDLQNRNLTLYSAKLRDLQICTFAKLFAKVHILIDNQLVFERNYRHE